MKQTFTIALLLAACAFIVSLVYKPLSIPSLVEDAPHSAGQTIEAGGRTIHVEVADTPAKREQGLSGREGLAPDEGMLFVFPEDGVYAFWMKDMLFPIDILWISREGVVVDMRQNVSPETYPESFKSISKARYVVELTAGYVQEHTISIGDLVGL